MAEKVDLAGLQLSSSETNLPTGQSTATEISCRDKHQLSKLMFT